MSRFTGELTITQLDVDYRTWRLEQPLVYEVGDENSGRVIEVHKLFETDGASIPRLFQSLLPTQCPNPKFTRTSGAFKVNFGF